GTLPPRGGAETKGAGHDPRGHRPNHRPPDPGKLPERGAFCQKLCPGEVQHQKMGPEPDRPGTQAKANIGVQHQGGPTGDRSGGLSGDLGCPGPETPGADPGGQSPKKAEEIGGLSPLPGLGARAGPRKSGGTPALGQIPRLGQVPMGSYDGLMVLPIDPFLPPGPSHEVVKMPHDQDIVYG